MEALPVGFFPATRTGELRAMYPAGSVFRRTSKTVWQEKVRAEYTPSQASEKATDSIVTEKILKAVEKEGRDKDGNRRLVKWSFLSRKHHFDRLGAALVKRVREAMMADGVIEGDMHQEYDKFENPVGKPVWTGMVQPAAGEGE